MTVVASNYARAADDLEVWAELPGWSFYEVSPKGRVRRKPRTPKCRNGRNLKSHVNDKGYPAVHLRQDGREKQMPVHTAVALAFIGEPPTALHEVAHGDGNSMNANLSNLRWATHAENEADKLAHGTLMHGETHPSARFTDREIEQIRALRRIGKTYTEIAERCGVSRAHACRIVLGTRRGHNTRNTK
ncbi:hypothetical protein F9L06_10140 [Brucella anthropi]|uniref:HNH endonuclease n=1 Tax=Brucella anthropi TaxID=529 RepID=A0A6I0DQQ7_BRUAN|nr:NUMOD4 domain-containing protein [Brucella anthropi]KAB2798954.1 hypothetical protein F9L06_10140 [Brucella anthropi]